MNISGKTRVLGLIGNPVEHTLSPVIHNTISKCLLRNKAGVCDETSYAETVYVPFHVQEGVLEEAIKGAYALNVLGMNVTVPYKLDVMDYLVDIDVLAKRIGAVNTLVRVDGGYKGFNTDAEGFIRELDFYGIKTQGETFVILGAGGASNAIVHALAINKARKIYIFNRNADKAKSLAEAVNESMNAVVAIGDSIANIDSLEERDFVAVQCTSVGLFPNDDECIVEDGAFFEKMKAAVDIVYKPYETKFMKIARSHGKLAANGLRMLLYQGIAAYEKFCDVKLSGEICEIAARNLERAAGINRPIVLTGYMGSGKTSVGKELAGRLSCEFIDTDELIVLQQNRTINEIFDQEGEDAFRQMETDLLRELLSNNKPAVISCGGGMPVREINRQLLSAIGSVIYLRSKPETIYNRVLGDTQRPLLKGGDLMKKIENMLEIRNPLYEAGAGICVDTDELSPQGVCDCILELLNP